ncbi:MAG: hypothetical protein GX592_08560 [Clostridiales bacterium]|nr:hypothetical protein [Clostridiales bacterium]
MEAVALIPRNPAAACDFARAAFFFDGKIPVKSAVRLDFSKGAWYAVDEVRIN